MVNIAKELKSLGYTGNRDDYDEILANTFAEMFPGWTDEELLFHPADAIRFCAVVKSKSKVKDLPEDLTLRTLVGNRKHPRKKSALNGEQPT